jgi:hypothetical protein
MSFWHSATFSNDGKKVLFSDEWGGGSQPRCRVTDKLEWGANAIFTIDDGKMNFRSYYKMPAPQTSFENCVAHNGTLIPIPGRDIMVQAFYQGGLTMFEWTDPSHPREIGFYDRGPMDDTKFVDAGFWSTYWYNGYIIGSEIARGMDIFELRPSGFISQNEIDAAKLVKFAFLNAQDQQRLTWPADFSVPRSYLDQLVRNRSIPPTRADAIKADLDRAQQASGGARRDALNKLAGQLDSEAGASQDAERFRWMSAAVKDLANASR